MGTRSLTIFHNEDDKEIVVMYRQFDGYPSGHGQELAEFLAQGTIVNGLSLNEDRLVFNGMGCLAAQVVSHFKTGPGGFYLHPAGTRDCWEEYTYHIYGKTGNQPVIEVWENRYEQDDKLLFKGAASEVLEWINREE